MATVTGMTADAITTLTNALVETGAIDMSGNLTLTTHDGTVIPLGSVVGSIPTATTTTAGIVELATSASTAAGTSTSTAVTPAALAALTGSTTVAGVLKLATTAEITAGTDTTSAVTPAELAGVVTTLNTSISGKQASDSDLTAIAAIAPANGDVIQRESGAWTNRTAAQLAADLVAAAPIVESELYSGSAWAVSTGAKVYVGTVDPTASLTVVNGSVWFDTSGS